MHNNFRTIGLGHILVITLTFMVTLETKHQLKVKQCLSWYISCCLTSQDNWRNKCLACPTFLYLTVLACKIWFLVRVDIKRSDMLSICAVNHPDWSCYNLTFLLDFDGMCHLMLYKYFLAEWGLVTFYIGVFVVESLLKFLGQLQCTVPFWCGFAFKWSNFCTSFLYILIHTWLSEAKMTII